MSKVRYPARAGKCQFLYRLRVTNKRIMWCCSRRYGILIKKHWKCVGRDHKCCPKVVHWVGLADD